MKLYLLIILFALFVAVGIFVYFKYYYRHIVFKDMVYICKSLKNNISFNKNTIGNLLENAGRSVSTISRNILLNDTPKKSSYLTQEDLLEINGFKGSLGNGNVDYEISNITYYENEFEDKKRLTKELLNKDGKMYLKLIIGVGLAVCIILI